MALKVKFAHAAIFRDPNKKDAQIGKFVTFNDSDRYGALPNTFFIDGFQSIDDFEDLNHYHYFLLGFDPDKEYNKELKKFYDHMKTKPNYVSKLVYDKYDSKAVIIPATSASHEEKLKTAGYRKGFVCRVIKNKNPAIQDLPVSRQTSQESSEWKQTAPSIPPPTSSSSAYAIPAFPGSSAPSIPSYPGAIPSFPSSSSVTAVAPIAAALNPEDHYNQLKRSKDERHLSQLFHMRNLNNFVKAELIEEAAVMTSRRNLLAGLTHRGLKVLDLACGKGGDINKWLKNSQGLQEYNGIDIAENSIKEFVERLMKNNDRAKVKKLMVGNLNHDSLTGSQLLTHQWINGKEEFDFFFLFFIFNFSVIIFNFFVFFIRFAGIQSDWKRIIPLQSSSDVFDIISCQFAMHYMFENRSTTEHFFKEISHHLKENGLFIATTIDCRILLHYIMKAKFGEKESTMPAFSFPPQRPGDAKKNGEDKIPGLKSVEKQTSDNSEKSFSLQIWNQFSSLLLEIGFKEKMLNRLIFPPKPSSSNSNSQEDNNNSGDDSFGIQYTFSLHDSENAAAVDSPEFIVPLNEDFYSLLAKHNLKMLKMQNFHDFILEKFQNPASKERRVPLSVLSSSFASSETYSYVLCL
jgi:SAM-dependent methyltransferase